MTEYFERYYGTEFGNYFEIEIYNDYPLTLLRYARA